MYELAQIILVGIDLLVPKIVMRYCNEWGKIQQHFHSITIALAVNSVTLMSHSYENK